jgi:hypothetical protein
MKYSVKKKYASKNAISMLYGRIQEIFYRTKRYFSNSEDIKQIETIFRSRKKTKGAITDILNVGSFRTKVLNHFCSVWN